MMAIVKIYIIVLEEWPDTIFRCDTEYNVLVFHSDCREINVNGHLFEANITCKLLKLFRTKAEKYRMRNVKLHLYGESHPRWNTKNENVIIRKFKHQEHTQQHGFYGNATVLTNKSFEKNKYKKSWALLYK